MKKFCSKCGSLLDLGKRNCGVCQAFNPFFISGFQTGGPIAKPEINEEAKLQVPPAQLPIVPELITKIEANQVALPEKEKIEDTLKNELLKVKEEAEQYKKETIDLVKGVQKELQDIEKENRLLKEKVESIKLANTPEQPIPVNASEMPPAQNARSKNKMAVGAIALLILATGLSYAAFSLINNKPVETSQQILQPVNPTATVTEQPKKNTASATLTDTAPKHKLLAMATAPVPKPAAPVVAVASPKPTTTEFALTTARVIGDLVGKKLSGCDITIKSSSEIDHVDNLVLVEKLSASYLKYKCKVRIKQGSDVYNASPYMYYSSGGTFIKVDGTNCE